MTMFQVPSENVADAVQSDFTVLGPESLLPGKSCPPKLKVKERKAFPCPSKEKVPAAASGKKAPMRCGCPLKEPLTKHFREVRCSSLAIAAYSDYHPHRKRKHCRVR